MKSEIFTFEFVIEGLETTFKKLNQFMENQFIEFYHSLIEDEEHIKLTKFLNHLHKTLNQKGSIHELINYDYIEKNIIQSIKDENLKMLLNDIFKIFKTKKITKSIISDKIQETLLNPFNGSKSKVHSSNNKLVRNLNKTHYKSQEIIQIENEIKESDWRKLPEIEIKVKQLNLENKWEVKLINLIKYELFKKKSIQNSLYNINYNQLEIDANILFKNDPRTLEKSLNYIKIYQAKQKIVQTPLKNLKNIEIEFKNTIENQFVLKVVLDFLKIQKVKKSLIKKEEIDKDYPYFFINTGQVENEIINDSNLNKKSEKIFSKIFTGNNANQETEEDPIHRK